MKAPSSLMKVFFYLFLTFFLTACGATQKTSQTQSQTAWLLIPPKKLTQNAINSCNGDFYVFEDKNGEPGEPYGAVLSKNGFSIGSVGDLDEKVGEHKSLAAYTREIETSSYNFVFSNVGGKILCGITHTNVELEIDPSDKNAIYLEGSTQDTGGSGGGGGGGAGGDG